MSPVPAKAASGPNRAGTISIPPTTCAAPTVWLVQGTPNLEWFGSWNDWAVALLGCVIFDLLSGREAAPSGRGRRGAR